MKVDHKYFNFHFRDESDESDQWSWPQKSSSLYQSAQKSTSAEVVLSWIWSMADVNRV